MSDRQMVAKELAERDGADWDSLSKVMVNAYIHNADLVIQERNPAPVNPDTGKPEYTCSYCKDTAFIESKPCWDCNPRGLSVEQVHPEPVGKVVKLEETEDGLDVVVKLTPEGLDRLKDIGIIPEPPAEDTDPGVIMKEGGFEVKDEVPLERTGDPRPEEADKYNREYIVPWVEIQPELRPKPAETEKQDGDSTSGTRPVNQTDGGTDTGKPGKPKKRSPKKQAGKRSA